MKKIIVTFGIALIAMVGNLQGQVIIDFLDIRGTGVFGFGSELGNHQLNVTDATLNGGAFPGSARTPADPIDVQLTYNNLDLDADESANDSVTFTIRWEKTGEEGGDLASFGQGMDTGFGNLNDIQVSVLNVSGTTSDSGSTIYFDGFTGANLGAGSSTDLDRTAEINGQTVTFVQSNLGGFAFFTDGVDFAGPAATLTIDNSGDTDADGLGDGGVGSIVARSYDLQFSLNEPVSMGKTGDFDMDGDVDYDDLDQYINNLGSAPTGALADLDLDGDSDIDIDDFNQHLTQLVETTNGQTGTFAGDTNRDGTVDVLNDAATLINNLNATGGPSFSLGNFNADDSVDVLNDAAALINNLGETNEPTGGAPAASAVPEPGSLSMLALAGLTAMARRRR